MARTKKNESPVEGSAPAAPSGYRIEYVKLADLRQLAGNPKKHSPTMLIRSMGEFGFTAPLMIDERTGVLVAGHGRLRALFNMRAAGAEPPDRVLKIDDDWAVPVIRGVAFPSEAAAKAYAIADNRVQEAGGWDEERLATLLREVVDANAELVESASSKVDLGAIGLSQSELDRYLRDPSEQGGGGSDSSSGGGDNGGDGGGESIPGSVIPKAVVCPKCGEVIPVRKPRAVLPKGLERRG